MQPALLAGVERSQKLVLEPPGKAPESTERLLPGGRHLDDLIERGIFVMGGPFADQSGSLSVLETVTEQEARELIAQDPFVANGVFELEEVRVWNVFVDELTPQR